MFLCFTVPLAELSQNSLYCWAGVWEPDRQTLDRVVSESLNHSGERVVQRMEVRDHGKGGRKEPLQRRRQQCC